MNVLSLFDGMSCGQIALKEMGIKVDKYYASEIDKHAIKQTMLNFPDTIQLGSVTDVDVSKLDKIDLLIGGSPCTNFSFAGKRNGMSTTTKEEIYTLDRYLELKKEGFQFEGESFLFWEYMRILNDIRKYNPNVKFLLENVEMGKKWERTLSEAIGLFGVHINSALVSAQNRKRIYWTNIRTKQMGLFGHVYSDIPQPEDRGILLKDILEDVVDDKYYLSKKMIDCFNGRVNIAKGYEFKPRDCSGKANTIVKKEGNYSTSNFIYIPCDYRHSEGIRLKADGKIGTLLSRDRNDESCGQMVCVAMRGRGENNEQQLEPNTFGKTNALTSVQKDNLIMQLNPSKESGGNQPYQQNRVYDINEIVPSLSAQMSCGTHKILVPEATKKGYAEISAGECFDFENPKSRTRRGRKMERKSNTLMSKNMSFMNYTSDSRIRRLTPTECARLQTIPEWYRWECSDTQAYRMLGNGWTIDVIVHIFNGIKSSFS